MVHLKLPSMEHMGTARIMQHCSERAHGACTSAVVVKRLVHTLLLAEAAPILVEEPAQALQVHTLAKAVLQHCKSYICQQIQPYCDGDAQAEKEMTSSPYFHKKKDGTWALSVYQPLKWGVVGTGAIAEDVCEVINLIPGANPFWSCAAKDSQKDADEFAEKHGERWLPTLVNLRMCIASGHGSGSCLTLVYLAASELVCMTCSHVHLSLWQHNPGLSASDLVCKSAPHLI